MQGCKGKYNKKRIKKEPKKVLQRNEKNIISEIRNSMGKFNRKLNTGEE